MREYLVFPTCPQKGDMPVIDVNCMSDGIAMRLAEAYACGGAADVWEGQRFVGFSGRLRSI